MKKLLVALLAMCIAFSAFSFVVLAEETTGDVTADATTNETEAGEQKTVESLVGAFYLQGEGGSDVDANGNVVTSDYNYQIADVMAKALNGTNKVPFYAFNRDNAVSLEAFAEAYVVSEINAAAEAGIDFFAYDLHMSYASINSSTELARTMNSMLMRHKSLFGTKTIGDSVRYAIVLDGNFDAGKSMERNLIVDHFLTIKGYLVAEDGRPVVFIKWNDDIQNQITKLNSTLKKAVKDPTMLKDGVESIYAVALNAPSYDEAINAGAEAISWTEGSGKNGAAYATMTATVEANWANGTAVIPNVVTGFDKTLLANNPINVEANKQSGKDKTFGVRYSRTGAADDFVAAATPEELVNHVKNAVATTNKPANFPAVMVYAWDDFMGGAYLCPTKTDKDYQYNVAYLNALRAYFFGKEDGISSIKVLDNTNQDVITDMRAQTITVGKNEKGVFVEKSKVDFDGNNLLEVAPPEETPSVTGEPDTTPGATSDPDVTVPGGDDSEGKDGGIDPLMIGLIAGGAVIVIAIVLVIVLKKKKKSE